MKNYVFLLAYLIVFLHAATSQAQNTMEAVCPLKVGSEIPSASLLDANGEAHELSDLVSEKPTVLIFYRGAWCGYCIKHLAELNNVKKDIEAKGYQVMGITPDQHSKLLESTKKSESEIPVYSDSKAKLITAFGLNWQVDDALFAKYKNEYKLDLEAWSGEKHHSLPVPAIFIIKDGIVQFQYVNPNYKNRLKAETLLAIIETL